MAGQSAEPAMECLQPLEGGIDRGQLRATGVASTVRVQIGDGAPPSGLEVVHAGARPKAQQAEIVEWLVAHR